MLIISLFPALFANRFLADWTSHSRGSAPVLSLLCQQFSSQLLSVTHSTILAWFHSQTDSYVGTLVCLHMCSAVIFHDNFCTFWWPMCDAICQSLHTKETHLAFTRLEGAFLHVARSVTWFSIPVKADAVVEKRYSEINLEIMSPLIFVPVFLPLWLSNTLLRKKYHDTVFSMHNPIHCPAKNAKVPPVGADTCRVIPAISVIPINTIHWLDVICMGMGFWNGFTLFLWMVQISLIRMPVCAFTSTGLLCAPIKLQPSLMNFHTLPRSYPSSLDFDLWRRHDLKLEITRYGSIKY